MKTVTNAENMIEIKKSKFIASIFNVTNLDDIDKYMEEVKEKYPKARHYTYAYILSDTERSSDDKEPTGTAGTPMLNVLKNNNLSNVLCVVTRYFGGIKLGVGPLTRAYVKSITEVLKKCQYIELEDGYNVEIIFSYNNEAKINRILNNSTIIKKEFNEDITYLVAINNETLDKLKEENVNLNIINKTYIKKGS
ncbi:MAG: YigZ family protein [Bacilli bacterium]|nr:YigZ family protein [Bacilli bacterium]